MRPFLFSPLATRLLLLPRFLPEQPRLEELRLGPERLASQVDVALFAAAAGATAAGVVVA